MQRIMGNRSVEGRGVEWGLDGGTRGGGGVWKRMGMGLEKKGEVGLRCGMLLGKHGIGVREWEGMEKRRGVPIVDMGPNGQ